MSTDIKDPSDLGNSINSFNIVECCEYTPIDMYICIPNLGYGFPSHVIETFASKFHKIIPDNAHSVVSEEDSKIQISDDAGIIMEKDKFAVAGKGFLSDHMITRIPLNSPCAKKARLNPPLKLPIPFRVRDISGSAATGMVMTNLSVRNEQAALYNMMSSVAEDETMDNIKDSIAKAIAASHFRAASDLNKEGTDDAGTSADKFTGTVGEDTERVEFTHLFKGENGELSAEDVNYQSIVSKSNYDTPWAECLLRPAIFVSYVNDNGDLRVYYSPDLTAQLMKSIVIEGKSTPPELKFEKTLYAFGVDSAYRGLMQDWMTFVDSGNEDGITGNNDLSSFYISSEFVPCEMFRDGLHMGDIEDLSVRNRLVDGGADQTVTCTLITPSPPLFTNGEIYRDNPKKDNESFYLPFSQAYLLPLASYSKYAVGWDESETCQLCGGTGSIGFTSCFVCDKGEGILCPTCLNNTERIDGTDEEVYGYQSSECSYCNAPGNQWEAVSRFTVVLTYSLLGKIPCPSCFNQAIQSANHDIYLVSEYIGTSRGSGAGTCSTCKGTGYVQCPNCIGNPDGLSETPGYQRSKCPTCFDSSSGSYRGKSTPVAGRLSCTSDNLEFVAGAPETSIYYENMSIRLAPTCNDTGTVSLDTCPACGGTGTSYRFYAGSYCIGGEYTFDQKPHTCVVQSDQESETDFTSMAYVSGKNMVSWYNKSAYLEMPLSSSNDAGWAADMTFNSEASNLKWLPPYMYEIYSNNSVKVYCRLPEGTKVHLYNPPVMTFAELPEDLGHIILDSTPDLAATTAYDGGTWAYVESDSDIPLESGIRCITTKNNELYDFTYMSPLVDITLSGNVEGNMVLHSEGFAHLSESLRMYYDFLREYKDVLKHVDTARVEEIPDYSTTTSRFLYAPSNAEDLKLSGDDIDNTTSWISLTAFRDVPSFGTGFLFADKDRQKTISEFSNTILTDMSSLIDGRPATDDQCSLIIDTILGISTSHSDMTYCEPDHDHRLSYVSKGVASEITSNYSGDDIQAVKGASIIYDTTSGTEPEGDGTDVKPIKPSIHTIDTTIADDGGISISTLLSAPIESDDLTVCDNMKTLATSLKKMIIDLSDMVTHVLIKLDDASDLSSPVPMFSPNYFRRDTTYDNFLTGKIEDVKALLGSGEDASLLTRDFIGVITEYVKDLKKNGKADRPSNLMQSVQTARGEYTFAAAYLSSIAGWLVKQRYNVDDIEHTFAAIDSDGLSTNVVFTKEANHKGLLVYNMRKAYYVIVSTISFLVATIERLLVYMYSVDLRYDPLPAYLNDTTGGNTVPLHIYGFKSQDGNPCYPKVKSDIVISELSASTINLNTISYFADNDDDIKYDVTLKIPTLSDMSVKPLPLLGFGANATTRALASWDETHKYAFEPRGIFEGFTSVPPTLDVSTYNMVSLSGMVNIQDNLSRRDYMVYDGNYVTYINSSEEHTYSGLMASTIRTELEEVYASEVVPPIGALEVEGEISMADAFPFIAGGPLVIALPTSIRMDNVDFLSARPLPAQTSALSGVSIDYATSESIPSGIFSDPEGAISRIGTACTDMLGFVSNARNTMVIFSKMSSDSKYEYVFPIAGQADTLLGTTSQGESLMMCYLAEALGMRIRTPFGTGGEVSASKISAIMGSSTGWTDGGTSDYHIMNYNLWLSKRRAYMIFNIMMSVLLHRRRMHIADWESSKYYYEWDLVFYSDAYYKCTTAHTSSGSFDISKWTEIAIGSNAEDGEPLYRELVSYKNPSSGTTLKYMVELVYATAQPTESTTVKARKAFHCYGFGSLFQSPNTGDNAARRNQRVTDIHINVPVSLDSSRMWAFNHLNRRFGAPFCADLDISTVPVTPTPPGNSYIGGWALPKAGKTPGQWETLNTPVTSSNTIEAASATTEDFLRSNLKWMAQGWNGIVKQKLRNISKDTGGEAMSLNSKINSFLGSEEGMAAFAIPRSGRLTDQIWLKITDLS